MDAEAFSPENASLFSRINYGRVGHRSDDTVMSEGTCWLAFIGGSMSGGEIFLILLALLLLFGSKNLPSIARNLGKSMESFRKASRDVTDEIMRADLDRDPPARPTTPKPPVSAATPASDPPEAEGLRVTPSAHAVERDEHDRA
jgi:sec-independent protein translocase protein TatA